MGQYYKVVNIDKKQYLHPHKLGDGLKLMEFGASAEGTMMALAVLLSDGNGRGGGDLRSRDPIVGSWAGDRIVIAGDYADRSWKNGNAVDATRADETPNLYCRLGSDGFEDISERVRQALSDAGEQVSGPL